MLILRTLNIHKTSTDFPDLFRYSQNTAEERSHRRKRVASTIDHKIVKYLISLILIILFL